MQAGDKLDFVKPFDPLVERQNLTPEIRETAILAFVTLCADTMTKFEGDIQSAERFDELGFITGFELSLRSVAKDGSYLHISIFGNRDEEGLVDLGCSVIEHDDEGNYCGGYMYMIDDEGVLRSKSRDESEDDDEDKKSHFNFLEIYEWGNELVDMESSDDESDRLRAAEIRAEVEQDALFDALEEEMGYDRQPVGVDEITQLHRILQDVILFPASEFPDAA